MHNSDLRLLDLETEIYMMTHTCELSKVHLARLGLKAAELIEEAAELRMQAVLKEYSSEPCEEQIKELRKQANEKHLAVAEIRKEAKDCETKVARLKMISLQRQARVDAYLEKERESDAKKAKDAGLDSAPSDTKPKKRKYANLEEAKRKEQQIVDERRRDTENARRKLTNAEWEFSLEDWYSKDMEWDFYWW